MSDDPVGLLVRALVADGAVRLWLVEARLLAEHTRAVHDLGPDAARIGGEAIVSAILSSAQIKGEEKLTLLVQGEVPRFSVHVDVDGEGALRARAAPGDVVVPDGRFDGLMVAVKSGPRGELYRGASAARRQTVSDALDAHFLNSTQSDAILRLGCTVEGTVIAAGGLLLERLPDAPGLPSILRDAFAERYGWVRDAELSHLLVQAAFGSLGDEPISVLDRSEIRWRCRCSPERIAAMLTSLGRAELQAMIDEDHGAEISCHFCGRVVRLGEEDLRALLPGS